MEPSKPSSKADAVAVEAGGPPMPEAAAPVPDAAAPTPRRRTVVPPETQPVEFPLTVDEWVSEYLIEHGPGSRLLLVGFRHEMWRASHLLEKRRRSEWNRDFVRFCEQPV